MQTGENSTIAAHRIYVIIVTCIQSALIYSKIQVYDVMVAYNN